MKFSKIKLNQVNGKQFEIIANGNSENHLYYDSMKLNGKEYKKLFINHQDIINGGKIEMQMKPISSKLETISQENLPYSLSIELEEKK